MSEDRPLPCCDEAEQQIVASLLKDAKTALPACSERIGENYAAFHSIQHRTLYEAITRMSASGKPINFVSVAEQLRMDGRLQNVGGVEYLVNLPDICISPAGVDYHIDLLLEYHQKRELIGLGTKLASGAFDRFADSSELLATTAQQIQNLTKGKHAKQVSIRDLVHGAINQIEECHRAQGRLPGISTGLQDLDRKTAGLHNGDMFVIAARPSMGKTSLAMNIAEHVACDQGLPVGVFSLEMTSEALVLRMLCSRARINLRNIQDGMIAERDFPKITGAAGKLVHAPLYIDDTPALSVFNARTRALRMHELYGIRLLIIDYLQLMRGQQRKNDNRQTEVAEISAGVKGIAKELKIPVIVLSQLNRELERDKNRPPRLSDLRESGAIEQDADVVAFLWRPGVKGQDSEEEEVSDATAVTLKVAKQRNGPTGDIPLTFLKGYTRFESAAKVSREDLPNYDVD